MSLWLFYPSGPAYIVVTSAFISVFTGLVSVNFISIYLLLALIGHILFFIILLPVFGILLLYIYMKDYKVNYIDSEELSQEIIKMLIDDSYGDISISEEDIFKGNEKIRGREL